MQQPRGTLRDFIEELRRRRVIRVLVVYIIAAWVVIEAATAIFPVLLLPDWVTRAVVALVLLGFPVALALAWAFDLTAAGVKRADAAATPPGISRRAAIYGLLLLALVMAGLLIIPVRGGESGDRRTADSGGTRSLAVLPFDNIAGDPENEYFSEGITEDIISQLSPIPGLKVISRTSVMPYKNSTENIRAIAEKLGVTTILEGSVRRDGERVRVVAQLIDARTDEHLWTETYNRGAADVLKIQSDIARSIARELQLLLSPQVVARLSTMPTNNPEAHNLYLKGRYYWNKRTSEGIRQAITLLERAVALDPEYAQAHAALAAAYAVLPYYGNTPFAETNTQSRAAARRALEIDSTVAEAHAVLGLLAQTEWDWDAARRGYQRAIELDPGYATGHQWYGLVLWSLGECEAAGRELRLAAELDPLSPIIVTETAWPYACAGDFERALQITKQVLDNNPTFAFAWRVLLSLHERMGRLSDAVADLEQAAPVIGLAPEQAAAVRRSYESAGPAGYWQERIKFAAITGYNPGSPATAHAFTYAAAGDKDRAFEWLERAVRDHEAGVFSLKGNYQWDPLRDDPRFAAILRRMNLE